MVDFIRHYQFFKSTTNEWVEQAIKKVEDNTSSPWSTYYGIYGAIHNSFGLNPFNPFINPKRRITTHTTTEYPFYQRNLGCDECQILVNLAKCPNGTVKERLIAYMIASANQKVCRCPEGTFQNPACCNNCGITGSDGTCVEVIGGGCTFGVGDPIEQICAAAVEVGGVENLCSLDLCAVPAACGGTAMCCSEVNGCEDSSGCNEPIVCDDSESLCDNIGLAENGWFCGTCSDSNDVYVDEFRNRVGENEAGATNLGPCLCGNILDTSACNVVNCPCPNDGCKLQLEGQECDTSCCPAGEEGCEPCPDGSWVPVGESCETEEEEPSTDTDPPNPCQPGSTDPTCVYCECTQSYQPIWWPCVGPYCTEEPCDPSDPECYGGNPVVCYNYNTNDPIYYNASSLGPSVVIEYSTTEQACGGTYSYANAALLCEIPDQFQLCVYLEDSNGVQTQISYDGDAPYGANTFRIDEAAATITLASGSCIPANGKVVFKRCTDDKKMLLSFTEGSKLSAADINASMHQLLFLIQEKEFASNNYFQVANTAALPGTAFFEVGENTTAGALEGATVKFVSTDGTAKTYKFSESGSATGTAIVVNPPTIAVKITGMAPAAIAAQLKAAIESSAAHGSKITITAYGLNDRKYTLKQATTGANGNTAITESLISVDPDLLIVPSTFVGGSSTSDSAMIQFTPATTLPISFNFAGANAGQVMIWNGQEVSTTAVPPLLSLSNIPDVEISSLVNGQVLSWNASAGKWKNTVASSGSSTSIDLTAFLRYDTSGTAGSKMAEFWSTTGGGSSSNTIYQAITESWSRNYLKPYVSEAIDGSSNPNVEKTTIPNAITAYGLGYLSSMEWFKDDVINTTGLPTGFRELTSGVVEAWWNAKTASDPAGTTPSGIHASFTWELSKGMGRRYSPLTEANTGKVLDTDSTYISGSAPVLAQQGKPFHDISDIRKCDTTGTTSTRAFSETLTIGSGTTGVSRVKQNNVASLTLSPSKSFTSGIGKTKYNSGSTTVLAGIPSHDYYLDAVREALSNSLLNGDSSAAVKHPLDVPGTSTYPNYSDGIQELVRADYIYSQLDNTADGYTNSTAGSTYNAQSTSALAAWYEEQVNMPAVVTYYLGTIYDSKEMVDSATPTWPMALEWKGNYNTIYNRNLHADSSADEWYSTNFYLGTVGTGTNTRNGGDHYFHKWLIRNKKADFDATGTGVGGWEGLNPFDFSHLDAPSSGSDEFYLLPGGNTNSGNAANIKEFNAGYSYLLEANRTFSWLQTVMPDMYDEYVWEVAFTNDSGDGNYHVIVDVSKHIDGCTELGPVFGTNTGDSSPKRKGLIDCSSVGGSAGGATNYPSSGNDADRRPSYHLYPSDFYPEFVSVWNQIETEKITASTRNHTTEGFDLVVRVPRQSRIAVVDRYYNPDSDGSGENDLYGPMALEYFDSEWADSYLAAVGSATAAAPAPASLAPSEANSNTEGTGGAEILVPSSIASVSTEAGIQFIRMGIPANLRIDFTVLERGSMAVIPIVS